MRRVVHVRAIWAGLACASCGFDSGGVGGAGSASVGDESSGLGSTAAMTGPSTTNASATEPSTTATTTGASTTEMTTAADSSGDSATSADATGPATTDAETGIDPTAGTSTSTDGAESSSSGEEAFDPYGPCTPECAMGGNCIELYDEQQVEIAATCAPPCVSSDDCPAPSSGGAGLICATFASGDFCALDCDAGACPVGMACEQTMGLGGMCFWEN